MEVVVCRGWHFLGISRAVVNITVNVAVTGAPADIPYPMKSSFLLPSDLERNEIEVEKY